VKRRRIRRFDAAVVGGRLHANYLGSFGYAAHRIEIGYDVVDNQHFGNGARSLMNRFPDLREKRYFLSNTRFLERKGIDALLRAYARYRGRETQRSAVPWHLVVSGAGEMEGRWKQLASELRVADTVHWPGFVQYDDLPSLYGSAGVFVHPARREPWGLVVNEAAAAGLPLIIGRRVGAACELVREQENGFLVDPDDVGSLADVLWRTTQLTAENLSSMGEKSKRLVAQFGPERFGMAIRRCLAMHDATTRSGKS
jgi:glycosyltransferase involved in cell wall biosynthesis